MSAVALRFLQSGSFQLGRPLAGLTEVPEPLRQTLIDAPYAAAQRVFDAALVEDAAFVVLTGDVIELPAAGPRGVAFLLDQFERLAARDIAVYWIGGRLDPPDAWPQELPLPAGVHRFPGAGVTAIEHRRGDQTVAVILGANYGGREKIRVAEFRSSAKNLPVVALAYGRGDAETLARKNITHWALGGRERAKTLPGTVSAHDAGVPQARSFRAAGRCGATLVELGGQRPRLLPIATDVVRYHRLRADVTAATTADDLKLLLGEPLETLLTSDPGRTHLAAWELAAESLPPGGVQQCVASGELLAWLREEFGRRRPPLWTASVDLMPPAELPPTWMEEDSLLGDFLREAAARHGGEPIDLTALEATAEATTDPRLGTRAALADAEEAADVLRRAALLGAELLRGQPAAAADAAS